VIDDESPVVEFFSFHAGDRVRVVVIPVVKVVVVVTAHIHPGTFVGRVVDVHDDLAVDSLD